MFRIAGQRGAHGVVQYVADTSADIAQLPIYHTPGSTAFVIETSERYMLNNKRIWKKILSSNSSEEYDEVIYDGGLEESDEPEAFEVIYDGGLEI